jgi:hypothetical protein
MKTQQRIEITPPNFQIIPIRISGTSPLMLHKFSEKARKEIEEKQTAKSQIKKKRPPKDYKAEFEAAKYYAKAGWEGLPCQQVRCAMIAACRYVSGFPMSKAKGAFFIIAHGRDSLDGTPLIKISGKSAHDTRPVRLESGVADLRNRPRYDEWWLDFSIQFDADMLSATDVANLLARAGAQVGIGELRPQSSNSFGGDFGLWTVETAKKLKSVGRAA